MLELRREGFTYPQIADRLAEEFQNAAGERTIRSIVDELTDESGEWRLLEADAEEMRLVPPVLAAEHRRSSGRVRSLTRRQAMLAVVVRRATPTLDPRYVLTIADYLRVAVDLRWGEAGRDVERDLELALGLMASSDDPDAIAAAIASRGVDPGLRSALSGEPSGVSDEDVTAALKEANR